MAALIFMIIFFTLAGGIFLKRHITFEQQKYPIWFVGFVPLLLGFIIFILSCFTTVGARTVGVETAFGKVDGVIGSGLHFKWP